MRIIDEFDECMHKIRFIERAKSDAEVANALDMPLSTFSDHKKRRNLPVEKILSYCESKNISIDWLLLKKVG